MNNDELRKILDEHKVWVESLGKKGRKANLIGANLPEHTFVIMGETYPIIITNGDYLHAGCQHHSVEKWRQFSKEEIAEMDGRKALEFYPRLLDILDFYLGKGERPCWLN
ncbi:hypothetical protein [Arsenophonus sp. PmNCSU2021_1]|uniref:hypothetical protein n=1 Tax=Arsenophonus sp. PmNCSU2021_1 TaxID=3118989 RepID=UPI002FEE9DC5